MPTFQLVSVSMGTFGCMSALNRMLHFGCLQETSCYSCLHGSPGSAGEIMKRQVCEVSKTLNESTGGTKVYAATQLQSSFLAAMIMATLRVYRFGQDS